MRYNFIFLILVGFICTGCCSLFCEYESGDEVEDCSINYDGTESICVRMILP